MIDAGLKSLSNDMGNAELRGCPSVSYRPGGDEHGILNCTADNQALTIGSRVEMTIKPYRSQARPLAAPARDCADDE